MEKKARRRRRLLNNKFATICGVARVLVALACTEEDAEAEADADANQEEEDSALAWELGTLVEGSAFGA